MDREWSYVIEKIAATRWKVDGLPMSVGQLGSTARGFSMRWTKQCMRVIGTVVAALAIHSASADTVEVVPAAPLPGEPFILRIHGLTSYSFTPFIPYRVELVGQEIQIEGCISGGGFAVGGFYWRVIPVLSGLPAGQYSVSVYRAVCQLGYPPPQWNLRSTASFVVSSEAQTPPLPPSQLRMWEFDNPSTLDYFMTADEREIVALETGKIPGWRSTFRSFPLEPTTGIPMCRFFSASFPGKAPHFYTINPEECATLKNNPHWIFEGVVGYAELPASNGECASGVPLYRAYNNGKFGAPNHRYRAGNPLADMVMYEGWVDEGIVACIPSL